jgi:hypothetical protein
LHSLKKVVNKEPAMRIFRSTFVATLCFISCVVLAQDEKAVRVAVLPCQALSTEVLEMSQGLPTLLTAALSKNASVDLVEREQLDKALREQALGVTGLVEADQAAKIGKLLGAKILVTEKAFVADREVYVSAHVINVETGRIKALTRSTPLSRPAVAGLCASLADDISKVLKSDLVTAAKSDDDTFKSLIERLKKSIGDGPRPSVTIVLPEDHKRRPTPIPDPAAATELSYILRKLRFNVIENDSVELEKWVRDHFAGKTSAFPAAIGGVDVIIFGGAISEDAGRTGNLYSARARIELTAMRVTSGEIVAVNRATAAAADTGENIAAKSAIQKATVSVAEEFITELVNSWRQVAVKQAP